jgi:cellulose synthase/poly-beta-1,6-N-acetylglucosamine synthase-like glycosyltransferase
MPDAAGTSLHGPVALVELAVDRSPPILQGGGRRDLHTHAAVVVRLHGLVIGVVELPLGTGPDADQELAERAQSALREQIEGHLRSDGLASRSGTPPPGAPRCQRERERLLERAPPATVIVATRDGEATLRACLESLLVLDYPDLEVIVVDSASRGDAVRELVSAMQRDRGPHVAYVREDRPGVALAHNRGLEHASGSIVAFTDDDVTVDRLWLAQIAHAFEEGPDVCCVTGLILPAELESPAQRLIDGYWAYSKGFARRVFDARRQSGQPLHPYTAGVFGSGANMAFRTDALRALGGFDPALGTGSPALGGDDLAAFFDVVEAGHRLVYEPTAVVWHRHRPDDASLRRQAYEYGVGLSAYLTKAVVDQPRRMLEMSVRAPRALAYALSPRSAKNARRPEGFPPELIRLERRGMAMGALAYARSRWQRRDLHAERATGAPP